MACPADSQPAFAQKALAYLDGLYGYALALTQRDADAEDLVQETYLRAVRSYSQLAPDSNLKSWMYAILRNAWLNEVRHASSGPRIVDLDDDQDVYGATQVASDDDPYAEYESTAAREDVRAAVANLPPAHREVIVLREYEGLSYQEIGEILGIPPGTVMSRVGRARERLRAALSQWDGRAAIRGDKQQTETET
jgi:RNA polymerase sigma-70 factor (ECF subfamily)